MSVQHVVAEIRAELRRQPDSVVGTVVDRHLERSMPLLDPKRRAQLHRQIAAELNGLGPLEPLLDDPEVAEVMVNAASEIWIERRGRLSRSGSIEPAQLAAVIERIISPLGLRLDRLHPVVDARLADGSRLCAIAPPLTPDGLCCSIRRFRPEIVSLESFGSAAHAELLRQVVERRCNVVVSGATSSGKTTLLNSCATAFGTDERIVTIEDTAELRLITPHVVRLEARRAIGETKAAVDLGMLVRAALRLRPDRLVIGEVRGAEAVDMVQALNTGHDGSFTTCHANSPEDALRRIETMVLIGAPAWPLAAVREQLHSSIDVIVHVARHGERRSIVAISEVVPGGDAPEGLRVRTIADATAVTGTLTRARR